MLLFRLIKKRQFELQIKIFALLCFQSIKKKRKKDICLIKDFCKTCEKKEFFDICDGTCI